MSDPDSLPTLPTNVIELILATIPQFSDANEPIFSVLNVLAQAVVPLAYASLIANTLQYETPRDAHLQRALKVLVADGSATARVKQLLALAHRSLANEWVLPPWLAAMSHCGNIDLLTVVATIPEVCVQDCLDVVVREAAEQGHVQVLNWCMANGLTNEYEKRFVVEAAAKAGHLDVIKLWHANYPLVPGDFANSGASVVLAMASHGQVDTLRWWIIEIAPDDFDFTLECWQAASKGGHVSMLQFAKSRNYTLPSQTAACVDGAAANGHVHVLKWWYQHIGRNQALSYTIDAMDRASANGHVAVLDWFCQSGLELRFTPAALRIAHENGHHDVVNWWHNCPLYASMAVGRPLPLNAFQQTIPDFLMICAFGLSDRLTPDIIGAQSMESLLHALTVACREGQVSVLDLINRHSNLQKRSADLHLLLKEAAKCNQPTVLQWGFRFLPSDGCDPGWWLSSVRVALKRGYINVLELLLAADYLSWDDYAADYFESACEGGCISSLVFLKDAYAAAVDSCSVDVYETAVMAAACHGHVHVLVWLRQNGLDFTAHDEYNWAKVVDAASACGHVHVLQWWMANKLPWQFTEQALWDAVKSKNGELIQWWIDSAQVRGEFMLAMLHDALDELDC